MSRLTGIDLVGPVEPWLALGLAAGADGSIQVGEVALRFGATEPVLVSAPAPARPDCDGVAVRADGSGEGRYSLDPGRGDDVVSGVAVAADSRPTGCGHAIGARRVDHVVLMTPDLARTCAAAAAVFGEPLKRERDAGNGVRQGFFRLGEVILEIVQSPQTAGDGPARFWGLVLVVEDLDRVCATLGPAVISGPRAAVQPGRRIATLRGGAGLGCAVALMSD